ncbi:hypothetical protein [Aeromicrobium sp. CTD01-1L150]|uniref:hypothetical protein n=1 Tax=Aeromicrobium sp. CTD01-1L150 TaxID=3341830 RepID=UPI0035C20DF4
MRSRIGPWGLYEQDAEVETFAELERFHGAVATALDGGRLSGHVASVLTVGWRLVGWQRWRPRWGRPFQQVALVYAPEPPHKKGRMVHQVQDAGWDGTSMRVAGRHLDLGWLDGEEADDVRRRFGWSG